MLHRVIHKDTNKFIRDIDLDYDELHEEEIAIDAPACVGDKRTWNGTQWVR